MEVVVPEVLQVVNGDRGEIAVILETPRNVAHIWPHIRAMDTVPVEIRRCSTVWPCRPTGTSAESAVSDALRDVAWRCDPGHVSAVPWEQGYVLGWCGA